MVPKKQPSVIDLAETATIPELQQSMHTPSRGLLLGIAASPDWNSTAPLW